MKRGDFNHAIVVVGLPGFGKSTYALGRLVAFGKTPAYTLIHDPGWRVPDDGKSRIIRHESLEAGARAIATHPGHIHSFATDDGEAVLMLAERIAAASIAKGTNTPVVILLDEGTSTDGTSAHRISKPFKKFLAGRRHKNVGMILTVQDPRFVHYSFTGLCTELVSFRLIDEGSLKHLKRLGVQDVARVRALPKYQHIVHSLG